MNNHHLWALRLGFSTRDADLIKSKGLKKYLDQSFSYNLPLNLPKEFETFMDTDLDMDVKMSKEEKQKATVKRFIKNSQAIKKMVLQRAYEAEYPLKENIALFWHNHFVSTLRSVKNGLWIFDHYALIHKYGTGNYKDLVKAVVSSNAMIKYLNNDQNRKGKINENLGRELLELFTLGEGNYSEQDIKNTAKALAGLGIGREGGVYRAKQKDNTIKEIFGKKGNFDFEQVVDLIFEQKSTPYFITRKILKWFIYDSPPEDLVKKYGDFLVKSNYELEPYLKHIFISEEMKNTQGSMMKSPIKFAYQVMHDLQIETPIYLAIGRFLKNQGMDIYEQTNVEGWQGGRDWLSSQIFLDRQAFVDYILVGRKGGLTRKFLKTDDGESIEEKTTLGNYKFNKNSNAKAIIDKTLDETISIADKEFRSELDRILVYDFKADEDGAQQNVNRLYQFITQSPEFQII